MVLIAPSVLSADFADLRTQIKQVENGGADWIHLDIMDGHFVPNISFGQVIVSSIRRVTSLPLDTHLMIEQPEKYLESFRTAGADRITVHYETCPHLHRTIQKIRELGASPGVSINPATPASVLKEILPDVDLVLVMTVNPGFGGQSFIPASLRKIRDVAGMIASTGRQMFLQVDGGIDPTTTPRVVEAGANVLVAGNFVFRSPDISAAVQALRSAARPSRTV